MLFIFEACLQADFSDVQVGGNQQFFRMLNAEILKIIDEIHASIFFKGLGEKGIADRDVVGNHGHVQIPLVILLDISHSLLHLSGLARGAVLL